MIRVKALGFDLFNTLITVDRSSLPEAHERLHASLAADGIHLDREAFLKDYRTQAVRFFEEARRTGVETHNRFWIREALRSHGWDLDPEDRRIARAVDCYFSAFIDSFQVIPGALDMLRTVGNVYRIGLLSNFTHGPAARTLIEKAGFAPLFRAILISGEMGYRKPHPLVFHELSRKLGSESEETCFLGDDLEADVRGAARAGLKALWAVYVQERPIPYTPAADVSKISAQSIPDIPRINSWDDLYFLLGLDGPSRRCGGR